ncbi:hypothetical protein QN372_03110 [Undibacterium sp. RTI2.1]|uniref:hypothetical protein n=1 Tax=unclassified Undibacterium TaxID=2630295 RepID=UPI002B223563|nr:MULTISPECIES: hypothetical protein [unclassified Undibacterium]MEB0029726.1 hypothetical protein [Undibacterium sp. RTI2.1]
MISHLPANTLVQMEVTQNHNTWGNEFCPIHWAKDQHGFIVCNLLGDQALQIDDIGELYLTNVPSSASRLIENPRYSATQAFWLQPSFLRLRNAGMFFNNTMLSEKEKSLENVDQNFVWEKRPSLRRFAIPEFEAMKQVMEKGVVEPQKLHKNKLGSWKELKALADADATASDKTLKYASAINNRLFYPGALKMVKQINLPEIKTSYFKNTKQLLRPQAEAEELSAHFQVPYFLRYRGVPFWRKSEAAGIQLAGWWDIGNVDIALQKKIGKNTIYSDGKLVSIATIEQRSFWSGNCNDGFRFSGDKTQNFPILSISEKHLQPEAILNFFTRDPIPSGKVKITNLPAQDLQYVASKIQKHEQFTRGALHTIDIDQDGIPDFAIWEAWHYVIMSDTNKPEPGFRMYFSNIAGEWRLLDIDEFYVCDG